MTALFYKGMTMQQKELTYKSWIQAVLFLAIIIYIYQFANIRVQSVLDWIISIFIVFGIIASISNSVKQVVIYTKAKFKFEFWLALIIGALLVYFDRTILSSCFTLINIIFIFTCAKKGN